MLKQMAVTRYTSLLNYGKELSFSQKTPDNVLSVKKNIAQLVTIITLIVGNAANFIAFVPIQKPIYVECVESQCVENVFIHANTQKIMQVTSDLDVNLV